ncbi:NAD-glutamate dehydrogenase [Salinicola rhizosphaerae]|uniref:NAD-specific glutamate dehydrogenase n=1 Tax=Salinicola rhizosphaerae TaxID=1443141 RepID=A0ABQ3EDN8_9GAMM|nr:NAD-glutamate dehydrogenase [Salinicola rhizosphaerae]GHB27604.1 NAD-specific glutamate dehydrogenase [Salinicola rhizosphaerae]
MQHVAIEGKTEFLEQLRDKLSQRLPEEKVKRITAFAEDLYATAPFEEAADRQLEDVYGATLAAWHFMRTFDPDEAKVRIFNPNFEEHGWQSPHTVVAVLHRDMPFLVDSVRMELNRRGLTLHAIHNAVLAVERDARHHALRITGTRAKQAPAARESIILIEVDRHTDAETLKDLEQSLQEVLLDVRMAVADFDPMCDKLREVIGELEASRPEAVTAADQKETIAFLKWLLDEHFTFLGFAETRRTGSGKKAHEERVAGSELGVLKLDQPRYQETVRFGVEDGPTPTPLRFAKSAFHARVHRPTYPDHIAVSRFDAKGKLIGEWRFFGLFTSLVYNESPRTVPVLRRKVQAVIDAAGVNPKGHNGKLLLQILEVHPRDDLFQSTTDELAQTAFGILNIRERRRVRLFIRVDRAGQFYSCLVFVPRDIFSTDLRLRIQDLLCEELGATFADFNPYLSESTLARIQFTLRFNGQEPVDFDPRALEKRVIKLARNWREDLHGALIEALGEEAGNRQAQTFRDAFPSSYRDDFSARTAANDIRHLESLDQGAPIGVSLYHLAESAAESVNIKLYHRETPIPLSDMLPVLENLGLRVISERPYRIATAQQTYWIHDFTFEYRGLVGEVDLRDMRENFIDAFTRIWVGDAENDAYNRLIIGAALNWRQVAVLRAYARYMKQLRIGLSQAYIANTLAAHAEITRGLAQLFELRFSPASDADKRRDSDCKACIEALNGRLDQVASLNDDLLLRRYVDLIQATVRTNFFQPMADGSDKSYISFKLEPSKVPGMPKPKPLFEIFVYSPRMEGVHLRGGKVARGGLRWSDRNEDFRTEILGLMKAQQVKNSVIVPVGAKGGFICKRMPENADRDAIHAEGVECYRILIRGLLDVTDNLDGTTIVAPRDVVRHDPDDPYLVVAADKGTATFSDYANAISLEYDFWLRDAFASGGAQGYDHKGMAITARGAWESVKRHFREMGLNTQKDEFTVLGIGDMAGDVFGNGMLLSDKILLVGAFNHRHIFVDPTPDAASAFAERKRLFEQPRSSWSDYDETCISEGGGVFSRDAKSISVSDPMKKAFGIRADKLSPNDLINAMLKSTVDLIWNGGIGTYVKAASESHADVGDKANDGLRIDGAELNCRVVGEGGNLGLTQRGRMEAAEKGVRVNTDFIDNAGGVNCSDHEVNIKILLDGIVQRGDMTEKQRNALMVEMTEEVGELVVRDNYRQTQALSLSELQAKEGLGPYRRFINELEAAGSLDRELEFLPSDEALSERNNAGGGMTLPELCVLISYAKSTLKSDLIAAELPADPQLQSHVTKAFPATLAERYPDDMNHHRLKREIVATQLANDLVDHMGIPFVRQLRDSTGASRIEIAQAYVIARDSFGFQRLWEQIEALDYRVDSQMQYTMMLDLMRLLRRATRWFLRQRGSLSVKECVEQYGPQLAQLQEDIGGRLQGDEREAWAQRRDELIGAGVPEALASIVAAAPSLYAGLGIIQAARTSGEKIQRVAEVYYAIGESLDLPWMMQQINTLEVRDGWQAQARETFRDDLDRQQLALTVKVLGMADAPREVEARVTSWQEDHAPLFERWNALRAEIDAGTQVSFPLVAVAIRELVDLAESDNEG